MEEEDHMKMPEDDPRAEVWNRYYGTIKFNPDTAPYRRWSAHINDHEYDSRPYSGTVTDSTHRYRWVARFWVARTLRQVRRNALRADENGMETFD